MPSVQVEIMEGVCVVGSVGIYCGVVLEGWVMMGVGVGVFWCVWCCVGGVLGSCGVACTTNGGVGCVLCGVVVCVWVVGVLCVWGLMVVLQWLISVGGGCCDSDLWFVVSWRPAWLEAVVVLSFSVVPMSMFIER